MVVGQERVVLISRSILKKFIEIDGYPVSSKQRHIGNHINKKLFVEHEKYLKDTEDSKKYILVRI